MDYKEKYLKYKQKYLDLKAQTSYLMQGGALKPVEVLIQTGPSWIIESVLVDDRKDKYESFKERLRLLGVPENTWWDGNIDDQVAKEKFWALMKEDKWEIRTIKHEDGGIIHRVLIKQGQRTSGYPFSLWFFENAEGNIINPPEGMFYYPIERHTHEGLEHNKSPMYKKENRIFGHKQHYDSRKDDIIELKVRGDNNSGYNIDLMGPVAKVNTRGSLAPYSPPGTSSKL